MADEYDEVEAVVRIPKGERLADSRKTEGWSRGFTPKSAAKGPEHVEIRLRDDRESSSAHEPDFIYVTEYVETPQRELTPAQQAVADALGEILVAFLEAAKPYVIEWFAVKRDDFVQRRHIRKAERKARRSRAIATKTAPQDAAGDEVPSQRAVAERATITLTNEQFQQVFMTWLANEDAQRALWDAIVNAEIRDEDVSTLEWRHRLKELTPEQRTQRVQEFLSANPSILRHIMSTAPLALGAPYRRNGG